MKKDLEETLRDIQSHPTTGTAHNEQLITTQVETIFMLDALKKEVKRLKRTIISLDKQNRRLEVVMILLTIVTTLLAVVQVVPVLERLFAK